MIGSISWKSKQIRYLLRITNLKGIVEAFHKNNVKRILGFASVGSLKPELPIGTLILPDDFFNLWKQVSLFEDNR